MEINSKYSEEDIIASINNIERAEPDYFLFTRLQQRIKDEKNGFANPAAFKKVLVPLYAAISFFIVMNIISYLYFNQNKKEGQRQPSTQNPKDAFAGEYNLDTGIY